MDFEDPLGSDPAKLTRESVGRNAVYRWRICCDCHLVYEHGARLATTPEPCPNCQSSTSDRSNWPTIEAAEVLFWGVSQKWGEFEGRLLGLVLLAAGAEVLFEEVLYDYMASKSHDVLFTKAILDRTRAIRGRIELFDSMIGSLKEEWTSNGLPKLYDDWLALMTDRNDVAHGRPWFDTPKFGVPPEEFVQQFLTGMAFVHNAHIAPLKLRQSTRGQQSSLS